METASSLVVIFLTMEEREREREREREEQEGKIILAILFFHHSLFTAFMISPYCVLLLVCRKIKHVHLCIIITK